MLPPAAGASAASTTLGTRTAIAARISERTPDLLCTCGVLVMCRMWLGMVLIGFRPLDRARDVEHRQHHEDEGLQERHEDLQRIQEPQREDDHHDAPEPADHDAARASPERPADQTVEAHQEEDDGEEHVAPEHVAEESQRERLR